MNQEIIINTLVSSLVKNLLDSFWPREIEVGKNILEQFKDEITSKKYTDNYVSVCLKIRTLRNADSDTYIQDIYSPLKLINKKNQDEIIINDNYTIQHPKPINIIGIAGQGKSTILRKLFLEEIKNKRRFPFFIELRKTEDTSIIEYLKNILLDIDIVAKEDELNIFLQSKKVILLLDGFDEIKTENRQKVLLEIKQIHNRFDCQVITTSRPETEICQEVGITNLHVKYLLPSDVIALIDKIDENNQSAELRKLLETNQALAETLITPILVNLFYFTYPFLDSVPNNPVEFYERLFITLITKHDKLKNFDRHKASKTHVIHIEQAFNAFCFFSLNDDILDFNESAINSYMQFACKLVFDDESKLPEVKSDIINITCLIQIDGYNKYVFLHKSIQEYHAAKFITQLGYDDKIAAYSEIAYTITSSSKLDNVINFLKVIDAKDFNKLLTSPLIEKFGFDVDIPNLASKIKDYLHFLNKKCNLKFNKTSNAEFYTLSGISDFENGFISSINLISEGSRGSSTAIDPFQYVDNINLERLSINLIESISHKQSVSSYENKNTKLTENVTTQLVSAYDFLIKISEYENFIEPTFENLINFINNEYHPNKDNQDKFSSLLKNRLSKNITKT